jgi:competence protein ComFA
MIERISNYFYEFGIKAVDNGHCNRCEGNNTKKDFRGVEYCLDCFLYKEVNSSMYLIRKVRKTSQKKHQLNLGFDLSDLQKTGSNFLFQNYVNGNDSFLQAVCGAGKTEMVLEVIVEALNKGKRVAFVIPRVEIIKQVTLRIKSYLPYTKVCSLYGGVSFDDTFDLIILTPQQLIRFYQEFDLMIIDEVDAFPFVDNIFLERLVKKSTSEKSLYIYMSATVSSKYKKKIENKELVFYMIPRRFHNQDLAVPIFIQADNYQDIRIIETIKSLNETTKKLIIYLPSIKMGIIFKEYLLESNIECDLITSETKYKASVLKDFENGKFEVLISTTILERGVTFDNVNVIVIEAANKVYNEATLIQIAGRVGRSGDEGIVLFFSSEKSDAMITSRRKIVEFNKRKHEM